MPAVDQQGRLLLQKSMLSVQPFAMQVGHFHAMERISSLLFVDFVTKNVVGLLVAKICGQDQFFYLFLSVAIKTRILTNEKCLQGHRMTKSISLRKLQSWTIAFWVSCKTGHATSSKFCTVQNRPLAAALLYVEQPWAERRQFHTTGSIGNFSSMAAAGTSKINFDGVLKCALSHSVTQIFFEFF